jgi:hypothetical protein
MVLQAPLERLKRAVRIGDPDIEAGEALAELARSDAGDRVSFLASVLEDLSLPARIQEATAIALGRVSTDEAEECLLRNLDRRELPVQIEIIRSLGRIGSPRVLPEIGRLGLSDADPRMEAARFAGALIAHRFGLPGHVLPFPSEEMFLEPSGETSHSIRIAPTSVEHRQQIFEGLKRHPYGIDYDPDSFVSLQCGPQTNVACLNQDYMTAEGVRRLLDRKALLGVVVLQSPETGMYSVSHLVLTSPEDGNVKILVLRSSGQLVLAGVAQAAAHDRLGFQLRAVQRPGAIPIGIRGTLDGNRLEISEARAGKLRTNQRQPELRSFGGAVQGSSGDSV